MTAHDIIAKGRKATAKVAAAYATYEAGAKTAKKLADKHFHVWRVDEDYTGDLYYAALEMAEVHALRLPLQPTNITATFQNVSGEGGGGFMAEEWTWLPLPGVSYVVQARKPANSFHIEFRAPRKADLEAVKRKVQEVRDEMRTNEPDPVADFEFTAPRTNIMGYGTDGWMFRKERASRSFESVILPAELQAEIEADLTAYTESRRRLERLELPWRRGYLLSGPPGTGKTSVSLAIAGVLGFNLASLSLTDIESDGELREAVSSLRKRTVLVLEDIDAYSVSHDREHNAARDGSLSLSGLLNALDGFETPDGLVTIATTNHVDRLDPALTRAGRFDRQFHLGYIQGPELERLFQWFYETEVPEHAPIETGAAELAPAEVTELFKQHLDDPEGGWKAVLARIPSASQLRAVA